MAEKEIRTWSMLCHLAALCGLLFAAISPFVVVTSPMVAICAILGPLIVWLLKRNDHPTIDANGREAVNFQLSVLIYTWVLGLIGALTLILLIGFAFLGAAALVAILGFVFAIVGAVKASHGVDYRYPFTIRFL